MCWIQSPCPSGRPLLIHASTGDTQTQRQVWLRLWHPWWAQGFVWAPQASLAGMGFDSKCNFAPPAILLELLLGCGVSFFGGILHSLVNGCLVASCNFGVQRRRWAPDHLLFHLGSAITVGVYAVSFWA